MVKTSYDFIDEADPIFRRKVSGCYVGFANIMDKYRVHIAESTEENRMSASDFLEYEDFLLDIMVKDFDCHESAVYIMNKYAEAVL